MKLLRYCALFKLSHTMGLEQKKAVPHANHPMCGVPAGTSSHRSGLWTVGANKCHCLTLEELYYVIGLNYIYNAANQLVQVHLSPFLNKANLQAYFGSDEYNAHSQTAVVFYNADEMSQGDAFTVMNNRDPVNIRMQRAFDTQKLAKAFGVNDDDVRSVYLRDYAAGAKPIVKTNGKHFWDLPNTVGVYGRIVLWRNPGEPVNQFEISCLSIPAPALDDARQPHYNYYVQDRRLNGGRYLEEMRFLAKMTITATEHALGKGHNIKKLIIPYIGLDAFLEGLRNSEDKLLAKKQFDIAFSEALGAAFEDDNSLIKAHTIEVKLSAFKADDVWGLSGRPMEDSKILALLRTTYMAKYRGAVDTYGAYMFPTSHYVIGDILETARENDLIVNPWDPHSLPGNGNDNDHTFDGVIGRASGMVLVQSPWFNQRLCTVNPDTYVGLSLKAGAAAPAGGAASSMGGFVGGPGGAVAGSASSSSSAVGAVGPHPFTAAVAPEQMEIPAKCPAAPGIGAVASGRQPLPENVLTLVELSKQWDRLFLSKQRGNSETWRLTYFSGFSQSFQGEAFYK